MRLLVLDKDFGILGDVSVFRTLIWTRRYKELGMYELHVARDKFPLIDQGWYLYRNDADELGLIEEVHYSIDSSSGKRETYCKGYFAEKLLEHRAINSTCYLSGNLEASFRRMVENYAISPADSSRVITRLELGDVAGITQTAKCQRTGTSLSEALYDIGGSYDISHRIRYDFQADKLLFEVWQGKDRRNSQDVNSWAVFSDSFCNIRNASYSRNSSDYKNFAFVAGEGEGAGRTVTTIDLRQAGEELRELYVDARDLSSENEDGSTISADDYLDQLKQRGREKLAEYRKVEAMGGEIDPNANLAYKVDFDLGDLCTYANTEMGIMSEKRITEITETFEGCAMTLDVAFGDDEATTVKQLIKRGA